MVKQNGLNQITFGIFRVLSASTINGQHDAEEQTPTVVAIARLIQK